MAGIGAYHVDEGYSEHPMVQDDQEDNMASPDSGNLLAFEEHVLGLSEEVRAEHVYRLLQTLRTSTIASIVDRLTPRLRMDPIIRLPPEIIYQIFSHLSPDTLMVASTVSKAWRAETLETSLWRRKFVNEGWYLNISKVLRFEREHGRASAHKPLSRRAVSDADMREYKRRAVPPTRADTDATSMSDVAVNGSVASPSQLSRGDELPSPMDMTSPTLDRSNTTFSTMSDDLHDLRLPSYHRSLMIKTPSGDSRLDYHRLYSIKSQLEENWTQGRYKAFQFPHPDHQQEAHTECVYTIQFSDKHLVSGSRDRTIRIWSLETFRLVKKPLTGHSGSVLSLQFDEAADEDLIISGSSDKSIGIWKFSTGKLLRKIVDQHSEAVLCVRFDKRYLATCSKDRLIKIFNRKPLKPGDADYPVRGAKGGGLFPDYVVDTTYFNTVEDFERYLTPEQKQPLEPYTLIMTLEQHSGAVNSLHIHDDRLASGSGDRTAKIFDLKTGMILTNCRAHNKGVACIEYDGARLVSGSSDETIRIFDPATNAEVGKLDGHNKLVRTIQVDFADAPGARETLEEDALLADQAFLDAQVEDTTTIPPRAQLQHDRDVPQLTLPLNQSPNVRQRRAPTPSHNAIGAKLPPGGGGNRWSRIVSGSYDETVLVWRREPDGRWVIGQRYKVADVLRMAGPPLVAASDLAAMQQRAQRTARPRVIQNNLPFGGMLAAGFGANTVAATPAPNTGIGGTSDGSGTIAGAAAAAATQAAATHQGVGSMPQLGQHHHSLPQHLVQHQGDLHTAPYPLTHLQIPALQNPAAASTSTAPAQQTNLAGDHHHQQQQQHQQHQAPAAIAPTPAQTTPQVLQPANVAAQAAAAAAAAMHGHAGSARAFKLQFDARRIICCSQDPKIVGWDFAAGNSEIIEAAKFFTRTSHYARGG